MPTAPSILGQTFESIRKRGLKYLAVSVTGTITAQIVLFASLHFVFKNENQGFSWVASNVFAVTVSSIPAFLLSKRWVWESNSSMSFRKEVLPFLMLAFAGVALSSGFVWVATLLFVNPLAANVANLLAFGLLWVFKFAILDKYVFADKA